MLNHTTFLLPGFFLTLLGKRQSVHFTQLTGRLRRAGPARLAIIDALNRGYTGQLEDLMTETAKRFDNPLPAIRRFVETLQDGGYLTNTIPTKRFEGEPSRAVGSVGRQEVTLATPISLVSQDGNYLWFNHEGDLVESLNLPELIAVGIFCEPITAESAREEYLAQQNADGLDALHFDNLVSRLTGAGLLVEPLSHEPFRDDTVLFRAVNLVEVLALVDARVAAHDQQQAKSGKELVQVIPVNTMKGTAPASLGLLVAYAMEYDSGRLRDKYDFVPMFLTDESRLLERAVTPSIFMFSNYVWNHEENLAMSAAVKAINPANITVHGGPNTPSYERDCEKFFADNLHVDIAVRGEGELTFTEILDSLDLLRSSDLEVLRDVPGLTFRTTNGVCRTGDRARIADLNTIPSPYLMGLFDEFGSVGAGAVIESNRGCPYGCTFCDWGSATLSKVRRFDLDRVFKELEWSAVHHIEGASIADANFGMLERDVAIAEKIAELKRTYGYPRSVAINYAKNQVKYLRQIIKIMADVEILTEGKVSLQTMDETTLTVIDRSNIKLDKYNELSTEFRRARLPLAVELMMGLPGATVAAFRNDLQECSDRDIRVMLNPTQLLPNSPMNDPTYRKEHGIVAHPGEFLQETASYTRAQWDEMDNLRAAYYLLDSYAILRYIARYVRREKGMGEVDFYDIVQTEVRRDPEEWPIMAAALKSLEGYMAPPGSWGLFMAEIRRYLMTRLDMPDDSGLRTALAVQHAHLPAPGRVFPLTLELEHDYAMWWEAILTNREEGHRHDWQDYIPRLCDFGPGTLTVQDPNLICHREIGKPLDVLLYGYRTWELDSPVARPRVGASME
jgi:radical SAM superfamily enzyme YgiQ (UPF0313 family)